MWFHIAKPIFESSRKTLVEEKPASNGEAKEEGKTSSKVVWIEDKQYKRE